MGNVSDAPPPKLDRLDHLGKPSAQKNRQRYKYGRTYTTVYDQRGAALKRENLHWLLVRDARKMGHFTMPSLVKMLPAFAEAVESGNTTLGFSSFQAVLRQFGTTDTILVQRLFEGFSDADGRVDYREFLRAFLLASSAPVEEKLSLACEMYDLEHTGNLSRAVLFLILAKCDQGGEVNPSLDLDLETAFDESTTASIERVWQLMREANERAQQALVHDDDDPFFGAVTQKGISREIATAVCREQPFARDFFAAHLNAKPQQVKDAKVNPNMDVRHPPHLSHSHAHSVLCQHISAVPTCDQIRSASLPPWDSPHRM